jgi:hypothetical protein
MKIHTMLLLSVLLLNGCESMPDRMRERFSAVPPKMQVFEGAQPAVFAAAQQAFKRLDFELTRSSPAQIEAVSRIHSSVAFADSRQLVARLHLSEAGPDKTGVELWLTEQVESKSLGGTSQQALREHGFFNLYFATLQQVLQEERALPPAKKD